MRINDLLIKLSTLDDLGKISWIMEKYRDKDRADSLKILRNSIGKIWRVDRSQVGPLRTVSHFVPVSSKIDAVSTSFYLTMAVVKLSQCSASQSGRAISGWFCNRRSCVRSTCILPYRSLRILSRSTKKKTTIVHPVWVLITRFSLPKDGFNWI